MIALLAVGLAAPAAINPKGIVNIASFRPQGLPNSSIAQGSLFAIFGSDLADDGLTQAQEFPLPTELGGVSISVTVDGQTRECPVIFTTPGQVAALLPSSTPVGEGELALTFSGATFTEPITVVESSPGIFTQNQQGSGPAIVTNFISEANQPINQVDQALEPGGVGTIWLTGLGPVPGDDAAAPLPGDQQANFDIEALVGGVRVDDILYAGRSGCCAGLDQIVFRVPANAPTSCYVPLVVVIDGTPSNYTTVSISESGDVCSQGDLFSSSELESFLGDGAVSIGSVNLSVFESSASFDFPAQGFGLNTETASASFQRFDPTAFRSASPQQQFIAIGSCFVFVFTGQEAELSEAVQTMPLDPGTLTLTGPNGTEEIPMRGPGSYFRDFSANTGIPGFPFQDANFLVPGQYTVEASGGADVGAFSASETFSGGVTWSNEAELAVVDRGQGMTVRWTGGNDVGEVAWIFGSSVSGVDFQALSEEGSPAQEDADAFGAAFFCQAPAGAGQFPVPAAVLSSLPASESVSTPVGSFGTGILSVGSTSKPQEFSAPGLDFGFFTYQKLKSAFVEYR